MKAPKSRKPKRVSGSVQRRVRRMLDFPEPPPQMDVSDPRWPDAFTAWCQRKAEWYGMDAIEMLGRALGCKKEADRWCDSQAEQRRKERERLEHMAQNLNAIYGNPPNGLHERPGAITQKDTNAK